MTSSWMQVCLAAGSYTLALTAFQNLSFAENLGTGTLADGFTGVGNLYPGESLQYAFDLVTPDLPTPEPGTGALLGVCLAALLIYRRRAAGRPDFPFQERMNTTL